MTHSHSDTPKNYNLSFAFGISLNLFFVGVEAFYGFASNSSALLADAVHNASDVLSLILAWAAIILARKSPSYFFSYGLKKGTILASLINGVILLVTIIFITFEVIEKFRNPTPVQGTTMMIVAGIGIVVNTGTALLFLNDSHHDINIRAAFLHMAADAAVTLGVLISGLVIYYKQIYWVDPLISTLIIAVILYSTWSLLVQSVKMILDAVPESINLREVEAYLSNLKGVEEVHDLHVWPLSTTETALSGHLVVPEGNDDCFLVETTKNLQQRFNIRHTTIQIERNSNLKCGCD